MVRIISLILYFNFFELFFSIFYTGCPKIRGTA
jgi:hypothetical protein